VIIKDKKLTGRQKRLQHFKQLHAKSGLNLVSLMDIFTILVFFLLVNSGAQQLPSTHSVKLPTSISTKTPEEDLILTISRSSLVVAGHKVADLSMIMADHNPLIPALQQELQYQAGRQGLRHPDAGKPHSVTIMGDEDTPYKLLSKILATCRAANYTHIAFAAYQKHKGKS